MIQDNAMEITTREYTLLFNTITDAIEKLNVVYENYNI